MLASRWAGTRGSRSAGISPWRFAARVSGRTFLAPRARGGVDRLLIGVEYFPRDVRPCKPLRTLPGGARHLRTHALVEDQPAQRLGKRQRVPGRREQAIGPVAHDVAITGDVGGHDGGGGGEGLCQNHPEALAAERRRADDMRTSELRALALLGDLPERAHAAIVEHHVGDLLGGGADERERRRRDVLAQRLERRQQDGEALALDGLPDEQDPRARRPARQAAPRPARIGMFPPAHHIRMLVLDVNAVRDDPVAPAVEAPGGPGCGLGDGDTGVQAVHPAASAERAGRDAVGQAILGIGMKGSDERQAGNAAERIPGEDGDDGLVDVDDVIAAAAQLVAHREHGVRRQRHVGNGAVGRQPDCPAERDQAIGGLARLRGGTPVQAARERVVGVEGRKDARLMPDRRERLCERPYVTRHATRVGPGIGRDEGDTHGDCTLATEVVARRAALR